MQMTAALLWPCLLYTSEIADCVRQVTDLNDKRLGSDELEVLASRIQSLTDKLIQE